MLHEGKKEVDAFYLVNRVRYRGKEGGVAVGKEVLRVNASGKKHC